MAMAPASAGVNPQAGPKRQPQENDPMSKIKSSKLAVVTLETTVVGGVIRRISRAITGEDDRAGEIGEVVAAHVAATGDAVITVLYRDGCTEVLYLQHGGITFLLARNVEELSKATERFIVRSFEKLTESWSKYGSHLPQKDAIGYVYRSLKSISTESIKAVLSRAGVDCQEVPR
jgi:hypothetical protein